jgi:hypothetical protein
MSYLKVILLLAVASAALRGLWRLWQLWAMGREWQREIEEEEGPGTGPGSAGLRRGEDRGMGKKKRSARRGFFSPFPGPHSPVPGPGVKP